MANLLAFLFILSLGALIVGLIKPSVFSKLLGNWATRKGVGTIFGIASLAIIILMPVSEDKNEESNQTNEVATNEQEQSEQPEQENDTEMSNNTQEESDAETVVENTVDEQEDNQVSTTPSETQQANESNNNSQPGETVSQRNAVRSAKAYLDNMAFSREGLIEQLEFEQFSNADAVYGADNSGANWNEQAAKSAETYLDQSAFSRGGLIDQLKFEGYTQAQAEYGVNAVGL
ncbi:MAG: Ltp family lipoprotein [Patescibacteria group bacterium]